MLRDALNAIIHTPFFDLIMGSLVGVLGLILVTIRTTLIGRIFGTYNNTNPIEPHVLSHNISLINMYKDEKEQYKKELLFMQKKYDEQLKTIENFEDKYNKLLFRIALMETILAEQDKKLKIARETINACKNKAPK